MESNLITLAQIIISLNDLDKDLKIDDPENYHDHILNDLESALDLFDNVFADYDKIKWNQKVRDMFEMILRKNLEA